MIVKKISKRGEIKERGIKGSEEELRVKERKSRRLNREVNISMVKKGGRERES